MIKAIDYALIFLAVVTLIWWTVYAIFIWEN